MMRKFIDSYLYIPVNIVMWIMLVFIVIAMGRVAWVTFYPYEPISIQTPMKIMNPERKVKRGGIVFYQFTCDKKMPLPAVVSRQLINHYVISLAPVNRANIDTGKSTRIVTVQIPSWAEPGVYYIHNTYSYEVSEFPKRTVIVSAGSETFEVVN